jgi:hypothetical protein
MAGSLAAPQLRGKPPEAKHQVVIVKLEDTANFVLRVVPSEHGEEQKGRFQVAAQWR